MLAQAARRAGPGLLRVRGPPGSGFGASRSGLGSEGSGAASAAGASPGSQPGPLAARADGGGSPAGDERRAERWPHSVPFPFRSAHQC